MYLYKLLKGIIVPASLLFCILVMTPLDYKIFRLCNDSLAYSHYNAIFWAAMNHDSEKWLNVVLMLGINLYALRYIKDKKDYLINLFCAIVWFQFAIILVYLVVNQHFDYYRLSPSLVHRDFISLQKMFQTPYIKVFSTNSFPSGHALVALYWMQICRGLLPRNLYFLTVVIAIILSIGRVFSGAHWFSDVIFALMIAKVWSTIFFYTKNLYLIYKLKSIK